MTALSLVLPCYNEAPSLEALVRRAVACAERRGLGPDAFRLVVVENGSTDDSRAVLEGLARGPAGPWLDVVLVPENRGYGWGLLQGLRAVRTPVAGWSHADEQCDPDDALRAWEVLDRADGPTLVKGHRHGRATSERFVSRSFEVLARAILGRRLTEINAQPKVFPTALVERLTDPPTDFTFDLYVLLRAAAAGYAIREIDVAFPPRRHGQSNWARSVRSRARTMAGFVRWMVRYRLAHGGGEPAPGGGR